MALTEPGDVSSGNVIFATLWNTLKSLLFDAIGSQVYTDDNYVTDDASSTSNIDALDIQLKSVSDVVQPTANKNVGEVAEALKTAYLIYNSDDTIDIAFPYKFSDGNTWSTISGLSTATTGKTENDFYWLLISVDGTKSYTAASGPVAGDFTATWSTSNNNKPSMPSNHVLVDDLICGKGNVGGDCDIQEFTSDGNMITYVENRIALSGGSETSATAIDLKDFVPPGTKTVFWSANLTGTSVNTLAYISPDTAERNVDMVGWEALGSGATSCQLNGAKGHTTIITDQTIYYHMQSGAHTLTLHIKGYRCRDMS